MARRKKRNSHVAHRSLARQSSVQGFYTPFTALDQQLTTAARRVRSAAPAATESTIKDRAKSVPRQDLDEQKLFWEAMKDVVPLRAETRRVPVAPPTKRPPRFLEQEEEEAYAQLIDLVKGDIPFELSYSDEYVDGAVVGLSPKVLKKLRNGDFSYAEYLDLHGYKREEAGEQVVQFVQRSFARNLRCILIIPGRGLNSRDKQPVLKQSLVKWLTRAPLKRLVLAFSSARAYDGGAGAFYVLLRRNEGKAPFVTPAR